MAQTVKFKHKSSSLLFILWDKDKATIGNLKSKVQRKGHASQLLKEVTEFADTLGITIILGVEASAKGGLNNQQLAEFYSKFGFQSCDPKLRTMERKPK